MAEPENETEPKPEKKAKKAKADVAPVESGKTEAAPVTQDTAPAVSEQPAARAEPAAKPAKKPAKKEKRRGRACRSGAGNSFPIGRRD
jgi:hypothetical protein